MDKISIIVPVYNSEKYISRCIDSIINQTYINIEIIIVNDGSLDGSGKILDRYAAIDKRIKVFHQKNKGVSSARNIGIKMSKGKYISFVDSDDSLYPESMETLHDYISKAGADIATGVVNVIYNARRSVKETNRSDSLLVYNNLDGIKNFMLENTSVYSVAKLYRANVIKKIEFSLQLKINEDKYFVYQALKNAKYSIYIDEVIYSYYQNNSSVTHSGFSKYYLQIATVADLIFDDSRINYSELFDLAIKHRINSYFWLYNIMTLSSQIRSVHSNDYMELRKKILFLGNQYNNKSLKVNVLKLSPNIYLVLALIYNFILIKRLMIMMNNIKKNTHKWKHNAFPSVINRSFQK